MNAPRRPERIQKFPADLYEPQKCPDCGDTFTPEDGESLCADCFERDREYAAQCERDERAWEWDINNRIKAAREDF